MPSGKLGEIPIDDDSDGRSELGLMMLYDVCNEAFEKGFTTKSQSARLLANVVAIAATEGLITTKIDEETWGNLWLLTDDGAAFMMELEHAYS